MGQLVCVSSWGRFADKYGSRTGVFFFEIRGSKKGVGKPKGEEGEKGTRAEEKESMSIGQQRITTICRV